jgi:hypothetical protein
MSRVYECGFLTISSNLAVDMHTERPPNPHEWNCSLQEKQESLWYANMLVHGPLAKRAWCLQECHLSPRILHVFENKIWIWECDTRVMAANHRGLLFRQDRVDGESPWHKIDLFRRDMVDRKILLRRIAMANLSSPLDILKLWDTIVVDYC